jgi:hypothetical protein
MNVRGSIDPERIGQKREKRRHHALTHFSSSDSNGRRRRVRPLDVGERLPSFAGAGGWEGASRARARRRDPRGAPWRSWRRSGASACPRSRRTGRRARAARRSRSSRASRQVDARFETELSGSPRTTRGSGRVSRGRLRCERRARETTLRARASRCDGGGRDARGEASIFLSSSSSSWLRTSSFFRRAAADIRQSGTRKTFHKSFSSRKERRGRRPARVGVTS